MTTAFESTSGQTHKADDGKQCNNILALSIPVMAFSKALFLTERSSGVHKFDSKFGVRSLHLTRRILVEMTWGDMCPQFDDSQCVSKSTMSWSIAFSYEQPCCILYKILY